MVIDETLAGLLKLAGLKLEDQDSIRRGKVSNNISINTSKCLTLWEV